MPSTPKAQCQHQHPKLCRQSSFMCCSCSGIGQLQTAFGLQQAATQHTNIFFGSKQNDTSCSLMHTQSNMWGTPHMTLVRNLSSKGRPAHAHHLSKYISIIKCTKPNHEKYLRHLSISMQKVQGINFQDLNQGSTCTMLHAVSKACRC